MQNLYGLIVVGKQKALIAFALGLVGTQLVNHGLSLDMTLGDALQALLAGLIAHGSVYFTPNK